VGTHGTCKLGGWDEDAMRREELYGGDFVGDLLTNVYDGGDAGWWDEVVVFFGSLGGSIVFSFGHDDDDVSQHEHELACINILLKKEELRAKRDIDIFGSNACAGLSQFHSDDWLAPMSDGDR